MGEEKNLCYILYFFRNLSFEYYYMRESEKKRGRERKRERMQKAQEHFFLYRPRETRYYLFFLLTEGSRA